MIEGAVPLTAPGQGADVAEEDESGGGPGHRPDQRLGVVTERHRPMRVAARQAQVGHQTLALMHFAGMADLDRNPRRGQHA